MLKRGDKVMILRGAWKHREGRVTQVINGGERYGVLPIGWAQAWTVSLAAGSVRKIDG